MLLRILLIIVGLYVFFLVSLKWIFPWLIRMYVKKSLSKMGLNNPSQKQYKRVFISFRKKNRFNFSLKNNENIVDVDYEEVKD